MLLHVGMAKGIERIAACRAEARKIPQIVFTPN
jgi:hypothetical protein